MKFVLLFFCASCIWICKSQDQSTVSEEIYEKTNYGLNMGIGTSIFTGKELQRPRLAISFHTGFFIYTKQKENRKLGGQAELNINLRGSKFANGYLGNSAYTKINLLCLEMPLYTTYNIKSKTNKKDNRILLGVQPTLHLRSVVLVGEDRIPANQENFLSTWKNLPLKPYDFCLSGGYQSRGNVSGVKIVAKYGLVNLNNNFNLPNNLPATGTGKKIGTFALEFTLMF